MNDIYQFSSEIQRGQLPEVFRDPEVFQTVNLGISTDLEPLKQKVEDLRVNGVNPPEWDRELVELVHVAFKDFSRRLAVDMKVWHWLCTKLLANLVWLRWPPNSIPGNPEEMVFGKTLAGHFLGSRSLNGVSRNTLARLWWCGETLYSKQEGYALAQQALEKQDLFQAVYERKFGLYPPAATACIKALKDRTQTEWRLVTRVLDHHFTTITVETLQESEIAQLIDQILENGT